MNEHADKNSFDPPALALRPKDAAKALGIGQRKLWELTKAGAIPHLKLGTCTIYPIALLEEWMAAKAAERGKQ